ncbi:hypothetical protein [Listeria valentina]|uniref:hypothetical protein n=1 Tax=Listeria valentina TaxID=2705293 RepID=UPI00142FA305|nr:hypothetical protein [Listeria valentina]
MTFLDCQNLIELDNLLVLYINRQYSRKKECVQKKDKLCYFQGKVLLIQKGTIALVYNRNRYKDRNVICRLYGENDFIYLMLSDNENFYLEALERAEYTEFSIDELSLSLEREKLFVPFLMLILSKGEEAVRDRLILETEKLENRLFYMIETLLEHLYRCKLCELDKEIYGLPSWLGVSTLASLINASIVSTSNVLKKFSKDRLIDIKTTIWKVNIEEWIKKSPYIEG